MRFRSNSTAIWAILDQAVASATTLIVTVLVARSSSVEEFGAFAVAFSSLMAVLLGIRYVASTPRLIEVVEPRNQSRIWIKDGSVLLSWAISLPLATIGLVVGPVFSSPASASIVAASATLPMLAIQQSMRFGFVAQRRTRRALSLSLTTLLLLSINLQTTFLSVIPQFVRPLTALGIASLISSLAFSIIEPRSRKTLGISAFVRNHRQHMPSLLSEFAATAGIRNTLPVLVGLVGGLFPVAAIRGADTLLGPLNVIFAGLVPIATLEARRLSESGDPSLIRVPFRWAIRATAVISVWGAILIVLPDAVGLAILGPSWQPSIAVMPFMIVAGVLLQWTTAIQIYLYGRARLREAARMRWLAAPALLILPLLGVYWGASVGAAVGIAGANGIGTIVAILTLVRVRRSRPTAP